MKGILRLGVVLGILGLAPAARAGFIDIKWDDCSAGGVAASVNKDYACDLLTSGFFNMVCSFDPDAAHTHGSDGIIADLGSIDLIATSPTATDLPQYWKFQPTGVGGCGGGSRILFNADFTGGPFSCTDLWAGLGSTGGQLGGTTGPAPSGNTARIKWTTNVTPDQDITVAPGTQYYVEQIRINRNVSACPGGCLDEVCLVFNTYTIFLLNSATPKQETDAGGVNPPYITWQQGGSPVFNCPIPTPARSRSWGEIKSLYR
jgi:hypothetical protein